VPDRSPDAICERIARTGAELLPATPSFLSLLLASGGHRAHDLSSLRVISYGAEPMPEATLRRLRAVFPGVELRQTYGLAEAGEQVFPSEIEGVIESVPGVAMAQVVAEPNVIAGHLLVASVALVPGADGDAVLRAARERCERTLSRPMVPRRWLVATGGLQTE